MTAEGPTNSYKPMKIRIIEMAVAPPDLEEKYTHEELNNFRKLKKKMGQSLFDPKKYISEKEISRFEEYLKDYRHHEELHRLMNAGFSKNADFSESDSENNSKSNQNINEDFSYQQIDPKLEALYPRDAFSDPIIYNYGTRKKESTFDTPVDLYNEDDEDNLNKSLCAKKNCCNIL